MDLKIIIQTYKWTKRQKNMDRQTESYNINHNPCIQNQYTQDKEQRKRPRFLKNQNSKE